MAHLLFEPSKPIRDVAEVTAEGVTMRLLRNGVLRSGAVTEVVVGETFDSSCAFWTRLQVSYSSDDGVPPRHLLLNCAGLL